MAAARGPMSRRVASLAYRHAEDGEWYRHDFAPGVELRPRQDGAVELRRPDGKPVWDRFTGTPGRFLINPPERARSFVTRTEAATWRDRLRAGLEGPKVRDVSDVERDPSYPEYFRVRWAEGGRGRKNPRARAARGAARGKPRANYGTGKRYRFHGAFSSLEAADSKAAAVGGFVQEAAYPSGRRYLVLTDKGARMARKNKPRRSSRKRRKARAVRRHRARAATRTNPGRRRRRPVRHNNPGGAMARRRRKHRRNPARAHRRRRATTRHNPVRGRHHRRRSYRRNPPGGILGGITRGIMSGATVTGGQILGVVTARQLGGILKDGTVKTATADYTPAVRQALVAVAGTILAGMSKRGGRLIEQLVTGLWAAPVQSAVRVANIPTLSSGLGECDALAGYAPVSRLSGYAPRSLPAPGMGEVAVADGSAGSVYGALGLQ